MNEATKLLPCPFCGGAAEMSADGAYRVQCIDEGCAMDVKTWIYDTPEQAATQWNTRIAPAAVEPVKSEPIRRRRRGEAQDVQGVEREDVSVCVGVVG